MKSTDNAWAVIQWVAAEIRAQPETIWEPKRGEHGERIKRVGRGFYNVVCAACGWALSPKRVYEGATSEKERG